jgi:predicted pyridoxine 5'-phosphate oxidase superfamily flavin-nucleotide-binding protein
MKLTQEMKELIGSELSYISTVDENGVPDVGPKMSMRVYDEEHLIYNEMTAKQTLHNLQDNGYAVVAVSKLEGLKGFRFAGKVEISTSGDAWDNAIAWEKEGHPQPKYAVVISIEKIWTLDAGPKAGELVAE